MKILLTGASGFLGKQICAALKLHDVDTLGRSASDIIADLAISVPILSKSYDLVIHCAGKAHAVPRNEKENEEFFNVNLNGTKNLLLALEKSPCIPKSFVFISTVAVYGRDEGVNITEEEILAAKDAYGKSKIEAEKLVEQWCSINNSICTILRLPLLAGPNPPGNLGAMIRGIQKGHYANIAGGTAKKSVVMASDVAKVIIEASTTGGIYNLTDGHHPTFAALSTVISEQLGKRASYNIPYLFAQFLAKMGDIIGSKAPIDSVKLRKITSDLTFDDSKARKLISWNPNQVLESFKIK